MFSWVKDNGLLYLKIDIFFEYGIKAYFTSRIGGVSSGNYSTLNLGLHTNDSKESILKNRELIADSIGVSPESFVAGEQVHGNKVYIVNKKDIGRGAVDFRQSFLGIDALITGEEGIPLISFYADCVPLFFVDPVKKVVALAHAGWRGTVKKIARNTIMKMKECFSVKTENILVAIGPSISKDFYQVDECTIAQFRSNYNNIKDFVVDKGKGSYLLDLKLANIIELEKLGILSNHILSSDFCTFRDNEYFYSYRREQRETGRMASIIYL